MTLPVQLVTSKLRPGPIRLAAYIDAHGGSLEEHRDDTAKALRCQPATVGDWGAALAAGGWVERGRRPSGMTGFRASWGEDTLSSSKPLEGLKPLASPGENHWPQQAKTLRGGGGMGGASSNSLNPSLSTEQEQQGLGGQDDERNDDQDTESEDPLPLRSGSGDAGACHRRASGGESSPSESPREGRPDGPTVRGRTRGSRRTAEPSPDAIAAAQYLYDAIKSHSPTYKANAKPAAIAATLGGWAKAIDVGMRVDGMTLEGCKEAIDEAHRTEDAGRDFSWKNNLLSGKSLRKNYERLRIKGTKASGNGRASNSGPYTPRREYSTV